MPRKPGAKQAVIENDERDEAFEQKAKKDYSELLEELRFRSFRAALMHYRLGSKYDGTNFKLEILVALFIGLISFVGLGAEVSYAVLLSVIVGVIINILQGVFPILRKKQKEHTETAAGWQTLAYSSQSCQILMKDPNVTVQECGDMYEQLILKREELCKVPIPESEYKTTSADDVFNNLKERQYQFDKFQEMKNERSI